MLIPRGYFCQRAHSAYVNIPNSPEFLMLVSHLKMIVLLLKSKADCVVPQSWCVKPLTVSWVCFTWGK